MIKIHYDFTDGTEVSYAEGLELKSNFNTNCLDFFTFDIETDNVIVVDKKGNELCRDTLLVVGNSYTTKEIRKAHNIQKMLKANSFNWK